MPHKCARCGEIYDANQEVLLEGCPSCGGKKFIFISPRELEDKVRRPEGRSATQPSEKKGDLEGSGTTPSSDPSEGERERIECIRILGPGTYELNIEKMASSDERVVGLQDEGMYVVDLFSMSKKKKKQS
jgi:predicted  nucleic acid-binding Zn-ribbon protein